MDCLQGWWLVGWWVGELVSVFIGWLVGSGWVGWLVGWWVGGPIGRSVGWLVGWSVGGLVGQLVG